MKYFLIGLLTLLSIQISATNNVKPVHIRGTVKDFKGGKVVIMIGNTMDAIREAIQVDANGVFDYTTTMKEPNKAELFFFNYECGIPLYLENGMEASLIISFVEKKDKRNLQSYDVELEYSGDNGDCTEFMKGYHDWSLSRTKCPWPFSRIDTMTFAPIPGRISGRCR